MALELRKLRLLSSIISYVNSYEWLAQTKTKEKIKLFLLSKYNYKVVAAQYKLKLNSLEVSISYAAKRLEKKIGHNTIDLILEGKVELAEQEFLIGSGKFQPTTELFIEGITKLLPRPEKDTGVELYASERELRFLSYFTRRNMNKISDSLDQNRIKHLLYLLTTNDSTLYFRAKGSYPLFERGNRRSRSYSST